MQLCSELGLPWEEVEFSPRGGLYPGSSKCFRGKPQAHFNGLLVAEGTRVGQRRQEDFRKMPRGVPGPCLQSLRFSL